MITQKNTTPIFSSKYLWLASSLSILTIVGIIYYTYDANMLNMIFNANIYFIIIACVLSLIPIYVHGYMMHIISKKELTLKNAIQSVFMWAASSFISPSIIGGWPLITLVNAQKLKSIAKGTMVTLYIHLLNLIARTILIIVVFITSITLPILPSNIGVGGKITFYIVFFALVINTVLLIYGLFFNLKPLQRIIALFGRLPFLKRYRLNILKEAVVLESYAHELKKERFLFIILLIIVNVILFLIYALIPTSILLAFEDNINIPLAWLRTLAILYLTSLMITPGGSGGIELFFVLLLGSLIQNEAIIGVAILLWRSIATYIPAIIGFIIAGKSIKNRYIEKYRTTDLRIPQ